MSPNTPQTDLIAASFLGALLASAFWIYRDNKKAKRRPTARELLSARRIRTSRDEPDSNEKRTMMSAGLYRASDDQLVRDRSFAHFAAHIFNRDFGGTSPEDEEGRKVILSRLIGPSSEKYPPVIEPPFQCDYGYNISFGRNFYANFGCVFLDCNTITIGNDVMLGPNVQIYTAGHPMEPSVRNFKPSGQELEYAYPIKIGDCVWIGGGAIILPGVSIGSNVVVAAGAVVTKDVLSNCVVGGVPARVIRQLKAATSLDTKQPPKK